MQSDMQVVFGLNCVSALGHKACQPCCCLQRPAGVAEVMLAAGMAAGECRAGGEAGVAGAGAAAVLKVTRDDRRAEEASQKAVKQAQLNFPVLVIAAIA